MSKPYFKINSATYSDSNLTINYTFWRNRGSISGGSDLTVTGISSTSSLTFYEPQTFNLGNTIKSIPIVNLGAGSDASFVDPNAITWTFGGTTSDTTNAKLTVATAGGTSFTQLSSFTASGMTLSNFISGLASSISSNNLGVIATTTSTTLSLSVPNTGNKFNNTQVFLNLSGGGGSIVGTSSAGVTNSATFSGGVTTFQIGVSTFRGGFTQKYRVSSSTYSLIP